MSPSPHVLPSLLVSGAIVCAAALSGCSSPAPAASSSSSGSDSGGTAPSASAAPTGDALNACDLVTSSMLYATLKITVPDGAASNAETCTYKADGVDIVVQTSTQASLYYPQNVYAASAVAGSIDLTGGDVTYGYYLPTSGANLGNVQLFVAKGEKAVFVTGNVLAPGTTQDVLNLATAITIAF